MQSPGVEHHTGLTLPAVHSRRQANIELHHGDLPKVQGVHSYQVMRAQRNSDGVENWTYNHAPMLAYWNDRFYLQYLSNPVGEHIPPGRTLLTVSTDGRTWKPARVLFEPHHIAAGEYPGVDPELTKNDTQAVMHQRMGFYVAPNGRLLTLGFYGISPLAELPPFDTRGIGRVVREIFPDDTWGPVYFIHLNTQAGWSERNVWLPWYRQSDDLEFIQACEALLDDQLAVQQWLEEHGPSDDRITLKGLYKALSYYSLPDGRTVGFWKWSRAGVTLDRGETWDTVGEVPSIETAGGKIWGQRSSDGRYVLIYNPTMNNRHRWPLALTTSDDGFQFRDLATVCGDVSPRRYTGSHKDFGLNYVRGIVEGNGSPPDGDVWVTYSMNKEDIWITRISVPITTEAASHIDDDFTAEGHEQLLRRWSIFSPRLAPVTVESESQSSPVHYLCIRDDDPYDYAMAERSFPESTAVRVSIELAAGSSNAGRLFLELHDSCSRIPVRVVWDSDGKVKIDHSRGLTAVAPYHREQPVRITLVADAGRNCFRLSIDDRLTGSGQVYNGEDWSQPRWYFIASVKTLSRVVLRTKPLHRTPTVDTPLEPHQDLPERSATPGPAEFRVFRITTTIPTEKV